MALKPFSKIWLSNTISRFWLVEQTACLEDFQAEIGENLKIYPFLWQRSVLSGESGETFLRSGQSTGGMIYFEQLDSWGGFFPISFNGLVNVRVSILDTFGSRHSRSFQIPRKTLLQARLFNPSFGKTMATLNGEEEPFELPRDPHGNLTEEAILTASPIS